MHNTVMIICSEHAVSQFVAAGIPTKIVWDSAVGAIMEQVDMVMVGAEGVMENGGIVNKVCFMVHHCFLFLCSYY